jgi:nucleotide-binding universal stress UspA family protein
MMQTRILVPLDGSRLAEQALPCAMTLGRGLSAQLILFRAVSIPSEVQDALDKARMKAAPLLERLEADANVYLEAMRNLTSSTDLRISHVVRRGPAAEAIVDYVERMDIHLLVMASHGYSGIKRWTHGSVAERVLQSTSVPVLLVRATEEAYRELPEARRCRRILVPLDGSKLAEQVLPIVTPIASALQCEIRLLRVPVYSASGSMAGEGYLPLGISYETALQEAEAYLDHLAGNLRCQGMATSTATWSGPVAQAVIEYAQANDIDLIAMCTHGRTGIARWAFGSVADRVLRTGEKPILLVRAQRD